jgi:hypothetical protein
LEKSYGVVTFSMAHRWKELQDNGQNVSVESVCADFPELLPAVRDWIAKFGKMEALLATQAPTEDTLRGSWSPDNILAAPQGPDEVGRMVVARVSDSVWLGGSRGAQSQQGAAYVVPGGSRSGSAMSPPSPACTNAAGVTMAMLCHTPSRSRCPLPWHVGSV